MSSVLILLVAGSVLPAASDAPLPWGFVGHEMAARAAVAQLPNEVPAFFRDAGEQLVYLDPEPDRWRSRALREMDQAFSYDHYIDLENVPEGALDAPDRYEFIKLLYEAGLPKPERDSGFLPFRIVELYQRIVTEWRMWRNESDPQRKAWIEQRIVNDAGVLGHYVTDASQPHHTTIHFNGWNSSDAYGNAWPNPEGYAADNSFHARFERHFVEAHVTQADVDRFMPTGLPESHAGSARAYVMQHIERSHAEVERLYQLDKEIGFDPFAPSNDATRDFAAIRLASGASALAVLWYSAWVESASPPGQPDA